MIKRTLFLLCSLALLASAGTCHPRPKRIVLGIALTASNHVAAELAAKEINAQGGIHGVPIALLGLEWEVGDFFAARDILKWADQFAKTKDLVAVIGHSDSASTLSAAAVYNERKVPQIVTIATNPAITNIGQWTYRLCISDAAQGPALAEYAVKDWNKKRLAIFYVNDAYGRGIAQLFEKRARDVGAQIVSSIMHRNALEKDDQALIRSVLTSLKKKGEPDLIVLFQRTSAALWTIRTIRELGLRSDLLGGDSLAPPGFCQTEPEQKEGMRVSQFFFPQPNDTRAQKFIESIRSLKNQEPDYAQAYTYDAIYLVRDALLHNGFSREGVKAYLDQLIYRKTPVKGIAGTFLLGPDHDARREIYIVEVQSGKQHFLKALRVE